MCLNYFLSIDSELFWTCAAVLVGTYSKMPLKTNYKQPSIAFLDFSAIDAHTILTEKDKSGDSSLYQTNI